MIGRPFAQLGTYALLAPPLLAIIFVWLYGSRLPLTDEWTFTNAVIQISELQSHGISYLRDLKECAVWVFNGHPVAVSFAVYLGLAEAVHFNSAAFLSITLTGLAAQLTAIYLRMARSAWLCLPVAIVLFSPAHYMDFIWGFQFVFTLAMTVVIIGLAVLSTIGSGETPKSLIRKSAIGLSLITLGAFCSALGQFGYPAAVALVLLTPLPSRMKTSAALFYAGTGIVFYWLFAMGAPSQGVGVRNILYVLTAIGGVIWGTPVGITEFSIGRLSLTGAAILGVLLCSAIAAARAGRMAELAFPLGLTTFGLLILGAISAARPYLGNWHIQTALPIVVGAYGCSRIGATAGLFSAARTALLALPVFGVIAGFLVHGPAYHDYVRAIETYALRSLSEPSLAKPYPAPPLDLTPDLVLFLAAHGRLGEALPSAFGNPAVGARIYMGKAALASPVLVGPNPARIRITASLPDAVTAAYLRAGNLIVPLYRMHSDNTGIEACRTTTCYSAVLLRNQLPAGLHDTTVLTASQTPANGAQVSRRP